MQSAPGKALGPPLGVMTQPSSGSDGSALRWELWLVTSCCNNEAQRRGSLGAWPPVVALISPAHLPPNPSAASPCPPHPKAAYQALTRRFAGITRLLKWKWLGLPGAAAGAAELSLARLANLRAREPLVLKPGIGVPQALSPPVAPLRWWRGEGAACRRPGACQEQGPMGLKAFAAQSVHRRCPKWWAGGRVTCRSLTGGSFTIDAGA
jgi:hypothetical protein